MQNTSHINDFQKNEYQQLVTFQIELTVYFWESVRVFLVLVNVDLRRYCISSTELLSTILIFPSTFLMTRCNFCVTNRTCCMKLDDSHTWLVSRSEFRSNSLGCKTGRYIAGAAVWVWTIFCIYSSISVDPLYLWTQGTCSIIVKHIRKPIQYHKVFSANRSNTTRYLFKYHDHWLYRAVSLELESNHFFAKFVPADMEETPIIQAAMYLTDEKKQVVCLGRRTCAKFESLFKFLKVISISRFLMPSSSTKVFILCFPLKQQEERS